MANLGSLKYLFVAVAFALTLVNVDLLSAKAQTQSAPQPAKVREVDSCVRSFCREGVAASEMPPRGRRPQGRGPVHAASGGSWAGVRLLAVTVGLRFKVAG